MISIVFIHRLDIEDQKKWLKQFERLMPQEEVGLPENLTDKQALDVEIAIVANPDIKVLERFPNLIWVQSLWAGVESLVDGFRHVNSQKLTAPTQLVRLIDPHLARTMAEAVLTWTLFLHRNIPEYTKQQCHKIWKPIECPSAKDVRVSVLGAGKLGQAAMQSLLHIGYEVNSWSRSHKEIEGVNHYSGDNGFDAVLKKTDILVCLLPLTAQTNKLLNKDTLGSLPKGAKLINFARGAIVNHDDLQYLLNTRHLSHAVLDVFEHEPLTSDSPLWENPYISILPHISATTNIATASLIAAGNVINYRKSGAIPETIDLIKGY